MKDKNFLLKQHNNFPEVGKKILFSKAEYSQANHIYFTSKKPLDRDDETLMGHRHVPITEWILSPSGEVKEPPRVDIRANTHKISASHEGKRPLKQSFHLKKADISWAVAAHVLFLFCYLISGKVLSVFAPQADIVEVSFGLTDQLVQTHETPTSPGTPVGQTQAAKTDSDLPQLPKNVVPDTAPHPISTAQDELLENKDEIKKLDMEWEQRKESKVAKADVNIQNLKMTGNNHPKEKPKIDINEYLKRKEEDLRKVAEVKTSGAIYKNQKDGKKPNPNNLPASPFASSDALPKAPPGLAPTGDEQSTNVASYNSYRHYLANQLRLNWNAVEGTKYPNDLKAILSFTINPFGYLIGTPDVVRASGNKSFDELALTALQSTFPVPNPPPKNIFPPQTFQATYTAKGVR